jgi:hypothetical protein
VSSTFFFKKLSRPAEEWQQDAEIDWLDKIVVKHRGRGAFLKTSLGK